MAIPGVPNVASVGAAVLPNINPAQWTSTLNRTLPGVIGPAVAAATATALAGLAGSLGAALQAGNVFTEFEASLTRITTLVGISREEVQAFGQDILDLAPAVGRAPQELADGLFFITSAGLRGQEALDALEASAKAAALGLGETEVVADAATSALNAYGPEVLSAEDAVGVLVKTVEQGKLEADSLAGSIGRVIPIASEAGVSFNEVGAALAAVSRTGLDANEGATALRGILATIVRPTQQAKEALGEYGLTTEDLAFTLREDGLLGLLDLLRESTDGNTEALATIIPNIRALTGFLSLTGSNADETRRIFGELEVVTGLLDERFEQLQESQAFRRQQADAARLAVLTGEGSEAAEALTSALEGIPDILEDVIPPLVTVGTTLLEVGANVVAGVGAITDFARGIDGTTAAVGLLVAALPLIYANPVLAGIGAVAALIAGIGSNARKSKDDVETWAGALSGVNDVDADGFEGTAAAVQLLVDAAAEGSGFEKFFRGFGEVADNLGEAGIGVQDIADVLDADVFGTVGEQGNTIDTWTEAFAELGIEVGKLDSELISFLNSTRDAQAAYRLEIGRTTSEWRQFAQQNVQTEQTTISAAQSQAELNRFITAYADATRGVPTLQFPIRSAAEYREQVGGLVGDLAGVQEGLDAVNERFLEQLNPALGAIRSLEELRELYASVDEDAERSAEEVLELAAKREEVAALFASVADDPRNRGALERAIENVGGDYEKILDEFGIDIEEASGDWSATIEGGLTLDGTATGEELLTEFGVAVDLFNSQFGGIAEPVFSENGELVAAAFADGSIVPLTQLAPDWEAEVARQAAIAGGASATAAYAEFLPVGDAIGDGIVAGVDFQFQLQQKALDQINRARAVVERDQIIDSPSKLWAREVGGPLGQGVVEGFTAEVTPDAFSDALSNAASNLGTASNANPIGTTVNVYNPREESIVAGVQQAGAVSRVVLA